MSDKDKIKQVKDSTGQKKRTSDPTFRRDLNSEQSAVPQRGKPERGQIAKPGADD